MHDPFYRPGMRRAPHLVLVVVIDVLAGCSGPHAGGGGHDASADGSPDSAVPPFSCEPLTASPTLEPTLSLHPLAPVAGQTVTLSLHSGNTGAGQAPPLRARIVDRTGTREVDPTMIVGGPAVYYFSIADLVEGEACLSVLRGDGVEVAQRLEVAPAVPVARGAGVWKITRHHQWTCDEQPTFGNLLHVEVVDEHDAPVEGAVARLRFTDDAKFPIKPDTVAQTFADSQHPKSMTTGADGRAELVTPWGEGIRSPIDARPSLAVYQVDIAGGASDVATEISTGLWETDKSGCNFCNRYAVNVYGHWSYTIRFQRDPSATEVCDVPTDHAGHGSCAIEHFYHDPARPSCHPVAGGT